MLFCHFLLLMASKRRELICYRAYFNIKITYFLLHWVIKSIIQVMYLWHLQKNKFLYFEWVRKHTFYLSIYKDRYIYKKTKTTHIARWNKTPWVRPIQSLQLSDRRPMTRGQTGAGSWRADRDHSITCADGSNACGWENYDVYSNSWLCCGAVSTRVKT